MRRCPALLALVLAACGPESPGGPGEASSGGGDDGGEPGSGEAPTGPGAPTSGGPETDSAGQLPEPPPSLVYVLLDLLDEPSGVAGVQRWQPGDQSCFAEPTPICSDPPQLGAPRLLVDGVFGDPAAIPLGSAVAVLFPYSGCDLACGNVVLTAEGHGEIAEAGGRLPPDLPCSTAADGLWLAVDFGVLDSTAARSVELELTDACSVLTDAQKIAFAAR
jgi:hypothetical protein